MDDDFEDDLEPGLIVAEEPVKIKSKRPLITFLLYLAMFALGLSASLVYRNFNLKKEVAAKASLVEKKVSDGALYTILSENIATLFNPKFSTNLEFYEKMTEEAEEGIRYFYKALVSLYDENNARDVFTAVEGYEEDFEAEEYTVRARVGFLKEDEGKLVFENLTKDGYYKMEEFTEFGYANDYFNQNSGKFSLYKFKFKIMNGGVYLKSIEEA